MHHAGYCSEHYHTVKDWAGKVDAKEIFNPKATGMKKAAEKKRKRG